MKAIEIEGLTKIYRGSPFSRNSTVKALNDLDLSITSGTLYALLGPNGAGKTTLLRILAGLTTPTSGDARLAGVSVRDRKCLASKLGVLPAQGRGFFPFMSGAQNFEYFAALQQMDGVRARKRTAELTQLFDLGPYLAKKVSTYSSGIKQRFLLCRALLHDPDILLLDEPAIHLDLPSAQALHALLRDTVVKRLHKTVLLTTHQLEESVDVSDTLGFLFQGQLAWEKSAESFRSGREDLLASYLATLKTTGAKA